MRRSFAKRDRASSRYLAATLVAGGLASCAREITTEDPIEPGDFVEAQFDPTNPIPVLQLIPNPTALAEKPEGGLKVTPAECELPSTKQCAAFASGWGVTTPVTLYFSGEVDVDTAAAGIKFLKLGAAPEPVAFKVERVDRPAPNPSCKEGKNGSNPERRYTDAQVPAGINLIVRPWDMATDTAKPLDPKSKYVVLVESSADAGLKAADGSVIAPSALFSLMNVPASERPVTDEGDIPSALLRSNVQSAVLDALYPDKTIADLSDTEKAEFAAAVTAKGRDLAGLFGYFNAFIQPMVDAGVVKRENLVFGTFWNTEDVLTQIEFDPLASKVPFPNVQLLTTPTVSASGGADLKVTLPINPCTGTNDPPGCDSASSVALKTGLNTLNGFSNTAGMSVTATRDINAASLEDKVVMYEVDSNGMAIGSPVPLIVVTSSKSATAPASIVMIPSRPLKQNTNFVVAILAGVLDADMRPVTAPTTYSLLKSDDAFVEAGAFNTAAMVTLGGQTIPVASVLQCSTVPTKGALATEEELLGTGNLIEGRLQHMRWVEAFKALEAQGIMRANVIMAWNYKTQSVTGATDIARQAIPLWDQLRAAREQTGMAPPRFFDTGTVITGLSNIANLIGIPTRFCLPLCQSGAFTGITPASCTLANATAHPLCGAAMNLLAGRIGQVRVYGMTSYRLRRGNFANQNPAMPIGAFDPARFQSPKFEVIPVMVALPAGTATTTDGNVPVAIFQHGLGQYKEQMLVVANSFASRGMATVAIDAPDHGARTGDLLKIVGGNLVPCPEIDPEAVACPPTYDPANPQGCTGGCDGQRDPSGSGFLSLNLFASRDNFRQFTIDQLTLINTIKAEAAAGGVLEFLGDKIGYTGQSLGGIAGGNLAAYAPELSGVVVNVGGGSLARMGFALPSRYSVPLFYTPLVAAGICIPKDAANLGAGCQDTPGFRQFMLSAQWVLDPGDPLANSVAVLDRGANPALGADKVLVQMTKPDGVVANFTTLALGRAYGFDPTDNSRTSHFQTYDFTGTTATDCHGFLLDPSCGGSLLDLEFGLCHSLGAQEQAADFLVDGSIGPRVKGDLAIPNVLDCSSL